MNESKGPRARAGALTRGGALRLDTIDRLRGMVIVFMALDHVRDFFHVDAFSFDPTDPARTTPLLFATRWITHLCAPTFVFLSGVSIFLQRENGKAGSSLVKFLLARGAWLIALELTVVAFAINFALPFAFLQVIWAIGVSMMLMAALVRFSPAAIVALGALNVAGHGLLAGVHAPDLGAWALAWRLAMEPGPAGFVPGIVLYPALPWLGIMCLGFGLGPVFLLEPARRRRAVLALGAGAIALFAILRALNAYGDPAPWTTQPSGAATALSFFNVTKYPPSLMYVSVTLGASLLLGLALERLPQTPARWLLAFGRTPLGTYVVHLYLIHLLACLVALANGQSVSGFINFIGDNYLVENPQLTAIRWGFSLPVVYGVWIGVLTALYPFSAWLARVKRRRRDWWLSYV